MSESLPVHWPYLPYIAGALFVVLGAWIAWKPREAFGRTRVSNLFDAYHPSVRERVLRAIETRERSEDLDAVLIRIFGGIAILDGMFTASHIVPIAIAPPLFVLAGLPLAAIGLSRVRNSASVRIAALVPRSSSHVLPWWLYSGTLAYGLAPLIYLADPAKRVSAILSVFGALAALLCAWLVGATPSVISSADPIVEEFVDLRTRRIRVFNCLLFVPLCVWFFLLFSRPSALSADLLFVTGQLAYFGAMMYLAKDVSKPPKSDELMRWFE